MTTRNLIALACVAALTGCFPPKNETVITDTTAFTEWTMPAKVVIVPTPFCDQQFLAYIYLHPRTHPNARLAAAWKVIKCYRAGYAAL